MIGRRARAARERAGLTQADVAERIGIATEVYGRLERGKMLPSVETLVKLCMVLSIPSDDLLGLRDLDPSVLPPPESSDSPEVRRLLRRVRDLHPRFVRLLNLLAVALALVKRQEEVH